ncbi:hypothetical protein HYH03_017731 [Edaphochlamys debaryana]|uniref:C-terminal processing peptidase n=1 Tax=Edaphochlamys debaryana TaxID=47281 RepID=A0A835XHC9_9CHLO|nr:hypothetical protein HYH03_017731 [Edaphochlamys debaryana]|eukprot:KAG2483375.1 hypothetical protein HYH03_017731 [Edaphochlamys debaryana]
MLLREQTLLGSRCAQQRPSTCTRRPIGTSRVTCKAGNERGRGETGAPQVEDGLSHPPPVVRPAPVRQPPTIGLARRAGAAFCAAAAAAALSLGGGMLAPPAAQLGPLGAPGAAQAVSTEQLLFLEAWRAVDRAYVDKSFNGQSWFRVRETFLKQSSFDSRADTYSAIRKLVASLDDPFTRFLEPVRLQRLRSDTQRSSVTGVGVELSLTQGSGQANSQLKVVTPAEGGPSERAGVRPGDVITAVDGKPTAGISLYEASDLLQGPPGTPVTLTVRSPGKDGKLGPERELPIVREVIVIKPVSAASCSGVNTAALGLPAPKEPGAGSGRVEYIRVSTFNANTVEGVVAAIKEAKSSGAEGIVLDLRNNPGGLFPAGVEVAKLLLAGGDVVLIADSAGVRDIVSADAGALALDTRTPLSVWVNRGTASASEVLAGALKDNGRAVVVGDGTFGKGLIQTVVDLSDGSGLAVTVAKYQTPSGLDINKVGIRPDIRVDPDTLALGPEAACRQLAGPDAPRVFG